MPSLLSSRPSANTSRFAEESLSLEQADRASVLRQSLLPPDDWDEAASGNSGGASPQAHRWMISYADILTLVLCFFLVVFTQNLQQTHQLKQQLEQAKQQPTVSQNQERLTAKAPASDKIEQKALDSLKARFEAWAKTLAPIALNSLKPTAGLHLPNMPFNFMATQSATLPPLTVRVTQEARGVVVSLPEPFLFEPGQAQLTAKARQSLAQLAPVLRKAQAPIRIEGHTDNTPLTGRKSLYTSNWELSTARATAVLRFLVEPGQLKPSQLSVAGYGEFKPIRSNSTSQGKQENRRVDIVVIEGLWKSLEPSGDASTSPLKEQTARERPSSSSQTVSKHVQALFKPVSPS
jgi:chemotaxis protein MotB